GFLGCRPPRWRGDSDDALMAQLIALVAARLAGAQSVFRRRRGGDAARTAGPAVARLRRVLTRRAAGGAAAAGRRRFAASADPELPRHHREYPDDLSCRPGRDPPNAAAA